MTWGQAVSSTRFRSTRIPLATALALLAAVIATGTPVLGRGQAAAPVRSGAGAIPLVENRGQLDPRVAFYAPGRSGAVYFTSDGATFAEGGYVTQLAFIGAAHSDPVADEPLSTRVSYFRGPSSRWHTAIPTFGRIVYRDLWPGIDATFSGSDSRLEYSFFVRQGADPGDIRLAYRGATSLALGPAGSLEVATPAGVTSDTAPLSFQRIDGRTVEVRSGFTLASGRRFGFDVGTYDRSRTLVIDPTSLLYSGFLGGSGDDRVEWNAVDGAGNTYVTGFTTSTNFPVKVGPLPSSHGMEDAFVAKVDATGALVYAGFLGGSGDDEGNAIAVDASGNAYVGGVTASADFPVAVGPETTFNGGSDGFITKVSPDGATLVYSGFVGGQDSDSVIGVAVDGAGEAYLTGSLANACGASSSGVRPSQVVTARDVAGGHALGGVDVILAKVSSAGPFVYFNCFGGSSTDIGLAIALDSAGNSYLTGVTDSTDYPAFPPLDASFNGGPEDAFAAKATADGATLSYSGFLGSKGDDFGNAIAVDAAGNAYLTGGTTSPGFPAAGGPDTTYNGDVDAFVTGLSASGSTAFSGFVGGSFTDIGRGIAVSPSGLLVVDGATTSLDFPVSREGKQRTCQALGFDAFVSTLTTGGSGLKTSVIFGGSGDDIATGVAAGSGGSAFVGGFTDSKDFLVSGSATDHTYNGGPEDGFVTGLSLGAGGPISPLGLIDFLTNQGKKGALIVGLITVDGLCAYQLNSFGLQFQGPPVFSPDGSQIAVTASTKGNVDVYLVDLTKLGAKPKRLTTAGSIEKSPAWSPSGKQIAFVSDRGTGQLDIWAMNSNGSHAHRLIGGPLIQDAPVWSPNGKTIVFQGLDPTRGITKIYSAAANGKHVRALTNGPADAFPNWAPNGKQIAFQRSDQIAVMTASGSNEKLLTHGHGHNRGPAFSPDGERIAFFSDRGGNDDIFVMNANGKNVVRLTSDKAEEFFPRWLPIVGLSGSSSSAVPEEVRRIATRPGAPALNGGLFDAIARLTSR